MNPYYFNDTVASMFDLGFTQEEVMQKGFLWRDGEIKADIPSGMQVIDTEELDKYE